MKAWKIGEWNKVRIRVEGGRQSVITTFINGVKVGVFDVAHATTENYDREKVAELLGDGIECRSGSRRRKLSAWGKVPLEEHPRA